MHALNALRRSPRLALVVVLVGLLTAAVAYAATTSGPAIQTSTPKLADQMTNIDVLRQQIKNYYGAPLATTGPTGTWAAPLNLDSNYAHEAESVAADGAHWLAARAKAQNPSGTKAIVLDVDDTTLATFNYELYSNWDYNPVTNGTFVTGQLFPAVPGMVDMVNEAKAEGYAIVFLTGRPAGQQAATLGNLNADGVGVDAGYPVPDFIFTKPAIADYPPYLQAACADELAQVPPKSCTTIHYKSATRAYLESLGYEIVGNFGDQYSDLIGGHADRTFKLPNPSYFLP